MVLAIAFIAAALGLQTVPDLSGTWTRDPARSTATGGGQGQREAEGGGRGGGLGIGPAPDQLTIVQTSDRLVIAERRGAGTSTITYVLNGRKTTNVVSAGRNSGGTAAYVSSWRDARLATILTIAPAVGRGATVTYSELMNLDADGSLVVETTLTGSPNKRTVIYRRILK
jgi:hypothetical protein